MDLRGLMQLKLIQSSSKLYY